MSGSLPCPAELLLYEKNSRAMMEILRDYSPSVEIFSIDEAFIDMTGMESLFGTAGTGGGKDQRPDTGRTGIYSECGGLFNKLLAKMASDFKKPDLVHTLFPEEIEKKMWGLPVRDLFFVGAATEKKLRNLGIHTVGELARTDPEILRSCLKKQGEVIWRFATGLILPALSPIRPKIEATETVRRRHPMCRTLRTARKVLLSLAEMIGRRIRKDGCRSR